MSSSNGIGCECKRYAKHSVRGETIIFGYDCTCLKYTQGKSNGQKIKGVQHMVNISFPTKSKLRNK